MTSINIPQTDTPRIVIVGGGFAGLTVARRLRNSGCQIVLIDKNNYHQFQPLFYQVAMSGLEPSAIAFPLRKMFQRNQNVFIRVTHVDAIDTERKEVFTPLGTLGYDYLILAIGATTNFYGNDTIAQKAIPMKSISEALFLRNAILDDYENAITTTDYDIRQGLVDIVIVGGGPTGVEMAGALAEMKKYILPKDYHEMDSSEIDVYLVQGTDCLLPGMSPESSAKALKFLQDVGVEVILNTRVTDFDGTHAHLSDGRKLLARKVIWAAGITGNIMRGLPQVALTYGNRFKVNRFCEIDGTENIYAIGDIAYMETEKYPQGHPQVAQVAIQQGKMVAKNLKKKLKDMPQKPFTYKDKGSMATIGRNRAVVDLPYMKTRGFFAWLIWLLVHLFSLIGVKNKVFVFFNWIWNYFTYDQSLRLIIRPRIKPYQRPKKE